MKLPHFVSCLGAFFLFTACGDDSSAETPGSDQRFGCVAEGKETFGELTEAEGRCLCRRSAEDGRELLSRCLGEDAYKMGRASCDSSAYKGHGNKCEVLIDDWLACRDLVAHASSCDALNDITLQLVDQDLHGCGTLLERSAECVMQASGQGLRKDRADSIHALIARSFGLH